MEEIINYMNGIIKANIDVEELRVKVILEEMQTDDLMKVIDVLRWNGLEFMESAHTVHIKKQNYHILLNSKNIEEYTKTINSMVDELTSLVCDTRGYKAQSTSPMNNLNNRSIFFAYQENLRYWRAIQSMLENKIKHHKEDHAQ